MSKSQWHYATPHARALLKPGPEVHLLGESTLVKSSAVREVRRKGEFFFKIDKRKNRSFRRELLRALALKKRGVPVVEHLACGFLETGSCLVTQSLEDSVTVEEYLACGVPGEAFLNAFADFLKLMIYKKVVHRDLHCGNILYVEKSNSFCLVDVRDAFPARWYHFFLKTGYPMRRLMAELAGLLPGETVCRYLRRLDVKEPQSFLISVLERKAKFISKEWERRREQILSGYPKFTRREGELLLVRGVLPEELASAEKIPADAGVFAASFYLDMVRIPHKRVLAWSEKEQCLWAEPLTGEDADSSRVAELRSRALLFGLNTACDDWKTDQTGTVRLSVWKGK